MTRRRWPVRRRQWKDGSSRRRRQEKEEGHSQRGRCWKGWRNGRSGCIRWCVRWAKMTPEGWSIRSRWASLSPSYHWSICWSLSSKELDRMPSGPSFLWSWSLNSLQVLLFPSFIHFGIVLISRWSNDSLHDGHDPWTVAIRLDIDWLKGAKSMDGHSSKSDDFRLDYASDQSDLLLHQCYPLF